MKDSAGKYWCVACGEGDQRRRASAAGGICAGCGESYSDNQMTQFGGMPYCNKCLKRRYSGKTSAAARTASGFSLRGLIPSIGGESGGGRLKLLLILAAVIAIIVLAVSFRPH